MPKILKLSEPQNHRCCYCTHRMIRHSHQQGAPTPLNAMTRDHLIPQAFGGGNEDNLIAACCLCNMIRGDMDAYAFHTKLWRLFQRKPLLHTNWHSLSKQELKYVRKQLLDTQERQLRGLAISSIEYAWRHMRLLKLHGHELRA